MSVERLPRQEGLSITTETSSGDVVLRMAGDLDLANVGRLLSALDQIELPRTNRLEIDLSEVDFLDGAGLNSVVHVNGRCKEHGVPLTVVKPRGLARRVFTLTRVHRELELLDPPQRS